MMLSIWLLVALIFFHADVVENNSKNPIKYSNINVDINKPIGYSIHRFRCYFTTCNYEFDPKDLSSTIWQIVDDEVVVIQNLHHIYKNYGRNHLIPVLQTLKKNAVKNVIEVLNVTLSKPMDSCSPFFLPRLIDSGWVVEKSPVGSEIQGLDHLIFKSGKECTPQIMFADKTMAANYNFTINATADPKLQRIHIFTRRYAHIKSCKEKYSCREYISLILLHKPTGTYQLLNVTINVLASGHSMPHITSHYVNHMKIPLDTAVGRLVGQVNVADFDPGFDGELVFTMTSTVSPYFYIDVFSGKVYLLQPIKTPIEGHFFVSVRDRSCYIHSQPLRVKLFYSTVPKIQIYSTYNQLYSLSTTSTLVSSDRNSKNAQQPLLYKVVNLYSDLPIDSYVISGAEFAKSIPFNHSLNAKFSFSDQHSKHLLYVKDGAVYYRGINEKNSRYLSLSTVHHLIAQIHADDSQIYTAHIYATFHPGRTCLAALPTMKFNKPFQIVDAGNFDTRIAFDPTIEFHHNTPSHLIDYNKKIVANDPCFYKKYINVSVVDSYESDNFYMSENFNHIASKYPQYDPDNDYYILLQAVNEICDSEIAYKGFAIVKLNVQLKQNKYNPFFHNSTYVFNISESLKPPSYVGSVKIRFADSIGYLLDSNYYYYIKNYNTITSSYIAVDRDSGVITLLKGVDRELVPQLKFGISAFNPRTNHSVETVIIINIDDEDDNPPVFPRKHIEINLEHNSGYIEQVLCVHADDKDDTRKFPLTYYIHSGPKNLFQLNPSTGVLSLVGPLKNYNSNDTIKLYIRAKDTKHFDEMTVDIFVEKSLDDKPQFQKYVHNVTLIKEALAGTLIASLEVVVKNERLFHVSCRFGRDISYTIASLFSVRFNKDNKACFLHLLRPLTYIDVKNLLGNQNYFLLELYDNKKNIMFPAQSLINIQLVLTDNRVVFQQTDYIFQHFEMIKPNSAIGQVNALNFYQDTDKIDYKLESFSDCHSSKNCSMERLHSLFTVDKRTGVVGSRKALLVGFEDEIVISATNSAGLQSVVSCRVIVLPLSYKPMFGAIKPMDISLSESSPVGTGYTIASFKATGHDHINAMVDIVGGNWLNHFKMVNNETITLNHQIDFEAAQSYKIRYRWKQIVDNNTFESVYLENVINIKVIDENDNIPIFPDEDAAFLIIQGLSYSRQYFAHFQAYDGDVEYKYRKINYKFINSKVSIFIHPTLGIVSVTNDFTLFDQVMILTVRAENEGNPSMFVLKNFSIIIVRNQLEDTSLLDTPPSDQYRSEIGNMNIEFNLDGTPIQYIPRKIYNQKPQYTIGKLFQNPFYGKRNFMCADPYGFNNLYPIDAEKNHLNDDNNRHFTSADSVYIYKVSNSVYRIQNIVMEMKSSKLPSLECNNFNDDLYFLSNNNVSQIKPKLSCGGGGGGNSAQLNLQYSLVSSSRRDFNDNVLTLGTHSGVIYIHKLPDVLFPITEYFTYQIMDPSTNNYVFGRISIQIVNINYDIKISDLAVIDVHVDSPVIENQFIYNPRLSDGRISVGYKFYWTLESMENSDLLPSLTLTQWLRINSTNGHITACGNYTLVDIVKLTLRATLLSPNGDNITSATQTIHLNPKTLLMSPMVEDSSQLSYSYTVFIPAKIQVVETPHGGLYVGRVPTVSKGISSYHCRVLSTNLVGLSNKTICDNIVLLNQMLYLSPTIYNSIEHFKRFLTIKLSVCRKKCVYMTLNILIIRPTLAAPYFVGCRKNHSIFVENNQPISIPLQDEFQVPEIFKDVFICNVNNDNSQSHSKSYLTASPSQSSSQSGTNYCTIAANRYLMLDTETNFTEKLTVDFKPYYLKYYADRILQRDTCSRIDLIVHNYFPYHDAGIDNYGVATVDEGVYDSKPIACIKRQSFGSVFSIIFPSQQQQQYVTIDINDGCVYMLKKFNYSVIQRLSLIIKEVLFKLSDSPQSEICQQRCVVHHRLIIIVNSMSRTPEIIINNNQHLNIPINAPINYKILDLNENYRGGSSYFFISNDSNSTNTNHRFPTLPIDIDPETNSLVVTGNISNYINNVTNLQKTITLNMVVDNRDTTLISSTKLHLNFSYFPLATTKPSSTIILPINQFPGVVGRIKIETLNPKDLTYSLKTKETSKLFDNVFSIDSEGGIHLLKQLDSMLFGYSYPPVVDLELTVVDNSAQPQPNSNNKFPVNNTITIPVTIVITHLWRDYSLSYAERDLTITYDELAQFGVGHQFRKFNVESGAILPPNISPASWDSVLFTSVLVPLMLNDQYHPLIELSPNGTLYKTVDNELLRKKKLDDQIYAVDLRNPSGDIIDSTTLHFVELVDDSQIKCVKFNSSPIFIAIHPTFKINHLVKTIHTENGCARQNFQLKGYFNEFADCFGFGVGRQQNNLYLTCNLQTLIELLEARTTVAFFFAVVEKNSRKKVYNRLIMDFSRLHYSTTYQQQYADLYDNKINTDGKLDGISNQPYFLNNKQNMLSIPDSLPKGQTIIHIEPLHITKTRGKLPNGSFMLKCSIAPVCPFSINSTTGAVFSKKNDLESFSQNQYNLSVVLVDQYHHYVLKRYNLMVEVIDSKYKSCNRNIMHPMTILIGSKSNKPGTLIVRLPSLLIDDGCFVVADPTSESIKNYFFVNPFTRSVYLSKKLPYNENSFNFAYFLTPTLHLNKRDPSSRFLLTVQLLKDDFNQIRFLPDKREFTIPKNQPVAPISMLTQNIFKFNINNNNNSIRVNSKNISNNDINNNIDINSIIIGIVPLDNSRVKIFDNHKLAARIIVKENGDESNYFSAHIHPNLTGVAIFLHRKLPIQHYVSRWNLVLEIYRLDDMAVVDRTLPSQITINIVNLATTPPLLNSSIGKIIADDAFPQIAAKIQLFSPDLLDPKYIAIQVDPKLNLQLKSFIRIVRSENHSNREADVIIQSLWKSAANQNLISFGVEIGYRQPNDSTYEKLLFSQQYTLHIAVLKKNTTDNRNKRNNINQQYYPQYLKSKRLISSMEALSISQPISLNVVINVPTDVNGENGSLKEMPIAFYREEISAFVPNYHYSNFTPLGVNYNTRSQSYFVDRPNRSLFTVSTITPPGDYKLSAVRTEKHSKIVERVILQIKVVKRNETLYRNENHIVMVLRSNSNSNSNDNQLGLLYTASNIFFKPKDFIAVAESKCFGSNSRNKAKAKVYVVSLEHRMFYSQQYVYMYVAAIDRRSNASIDRSVIRETLENCQAQIEKQLSATVVSFDNNDCVSHTCQIGTCVARTTINYDATVATAYVISDDNGDSTNYHVYPSLKRHVECSSLASYSYTNTNNYNNVNVKQNQRSNQNICLNGGFKEILKILPINNLNSNLNNSNSNNFICHCPGGFHGKYCQSTEISFSDKLQEPLIYNPIIFDVNTEISFSFATSAPNGMLLLQQSSPNDILQHFHFAVKLQNGSLVVELLFYNMNNDNNLLLLQQNTYQDVISTNMTLIVVGSDLNDGRMHHVKIVKRHRNITVKLDNCENNVHNEQPHQKTNYNYSACGISTLLLSENNVHNGSLKLLLGPKFAGCINELTIDDVVMDFNSFARPQPPHVTLNMCLLGLKSCPRCKNGYCDRSVKPPYTCRCYDGWTGPNCNQRLNSYHIKKDGYMVVDQSAFYHTTNTPKQMERSEYSFYVDLAPIFSVDKVYGRPALNHDNDHIIFVYESNDELTEYSFVRLRNGFIEFVTNLGDGDCLVQFPFDFRHFYSSSLLKGGFKSKNKIKNILFGKDDDYKMEHLRDRTLHSPLKNGFLKIIAKRYRNVVTLEIPHFGYGEVSNRCGINNLLLTNHKIFVGNAPNNSAHYVKYNNSVSTCYASVVINGIDVNDFTGNIVKYNATVDCPCKENRLICVGKSMCVRSHDDYCGCSGSPGSYCGHLQLTFTGRNLMYVLALLTIFVSLWVWLCMLIYKHFSFRYYKFKPNSPHKPTKQSPQASLQELFDFDKPQDNNNCSSSYHSSLQQLNDINVKNIMTNLKDTNDELMHFDNPDVHDDYKPTFKIFLKQSDDEEINDQFKTLPPLANDDVNHSTPYKSNNPFD